jgi:single-stranded DNA-binding protein
MARIHVASVNRVILTGDVVGEVVFSKTPAGKEACTFSIQDEKSMIVRGESKIVTRKHTVFCTNQFSVPVFKKHLKAGLTVHVLGQLGYDNDGRARIEVFDYEASASLAYMPGDNEQEASPAPAAAPKPAQGGGARVTGLPPKQAAKPAREEDEDSYFNERNVLADRGGSNAPEGFNDDDIPF